MSDTNVSKVLGFINRSIIDFNFGIVSILDFQEKYFNPEKVFFKLLPSLMTKEGSLKDCTQREISIFSKFLLKSSYFFQYTLLGYLLVKSKTFTFNILGRYQVKPFRKLDSLSSQLPMLRFFSQNENTEIFFSETLIKVFMRKSSENKLRVVQSHFSITISKLASYCLTHFIPLVSFYTLWTHQKARGFLIISRGIERDQWHEMG